VSGFRQVLSANMINRLFSLLSQFAPTSKSQFIYDLAFLLASQMIAMMLSRTDSGRLDRASENWAMTCRVSHRDAPGPAPLNSAFA